MDTNIWGIQSPQLRNIWQARDVTRDEPTGPWGSWIHCFFFLFVLLGERKPSAVKRWCRFPSAKRPDRPFLKTSILEADLEGQDHTFPWWEKLAFRDRYFWHHKLCGRSWPGRLLSELPVSVSTSASVHGDPSPRCCQASKYFFSFLHEFLFLLNPDVSGPSPQWTKMLLHYLDSRWRNPQGKGCTLNLDPCYMCYGEVCITLSSSSHVDQTSGNKHTPELWGITQGRTKKYERLPTYLSVLETTFLPFPICLKALLGNSERKEKDIYAGCEGASESVLLQGTAQVDIGDVISSGALFLCHQYMPRALCKGLSWDCNSFQTQETFSRFYGNDIAAWILWL